MDQILDETMLGRAAVVAGFLVLWKLRLLLFWIILVNSVVWIIWKPKTKLKLQPVIHNIWNMDDSDKLNSSTCCFCVEAKLLLWGEETPSVNKQSSKCCVYCHSGENGSSVLSSLSSCWESCGWGWNRADKSFHQVLSCSCFMLMLEMSGIEM